MWLSAAQSAFANVLLGKLRTNAPSISTALVLATGASDIRNVFKGEELTQVLGAYMSGLKIAFALVIASTGIAMLACLGSKWNRLPTAKSEQAAKAETQSDGSVSV